MTGDTEFEVGNPTRMNLRPLPPWQREGREVCWWGDDCGHDHARGNPAEVIPDDIYEHLPGWTAQSGQLQIGD